MSRVRVSRRHLLGAATVLPLAATPQVFASGRIALPATGAPPICRAAAAVPVTVLPEKKALKLTWNANAICTVGVPVAQQKGLFARRNLEVELINFGGSTDQLLEAIATGKADAGVGMAAAASWRCSSGGIATAPPRPAWS